MASSIQGILSKELRQHGTMFFAFLLLLAIAFGLIQQSDLLVRNSGSVFALLQRVNVFLLPLSCLVIGNAMIASEFRHRTQVFLEGLPLQRWVFVAIKYLFGLSMTIAIAIVLLAIAIAGSFASEAMTERFALLLTAKTVAWGCFCWSGMFALSFLGRYRIAIGIVAIVGGMWMTSVADVPLHRFGPFHLMGDRFAYERVEWPITALLQTAGLIALFTCLGLYFGLARDATLATMLSEKMSNREKTIVTGTILFAMCVISSVADRIEGTDPLDLPGSIDVQTDACTVSAAAAVKTVTDEEQTELQKHANEIASLLQQVAAYLSIAKLPPLFLVHRRDLDENVFEDGPLDSRQGYLIRYNMLKNATTDRQLREHILRQLLDVHQHYRMQSDTRGWVLEGFAAWWSNEELSISPATFLEERGQSSLATEQTLSEVDLRTWKKFRKSLKDQKQSASIAGVLVIRLNETDPKGLKQFLTAALSHRPPHDVRATLRDAWYNIDFLLLSTMGLDLKAVAAHWTNLGSTNEVSP